MNLHDLYEGLTAREKFARAQHEREVKHRNAEAEQSKLPPEQRATAAIDRLEKHLDQKVDEHGGGGGGPREWHSYVKAHRTNEEEVEEGFFGDIKVNNAIRRHERKQDAAMSQGDYSTAAKEIKRAGRLEKKFHHDDEVEEGFQDFNKVEPYAVCLAGKPVKKFDYYEQARRFHDNWKQKLYREGDKAKADKITLMPLNLDEDDPMGGATVDIDQMAGATADTNPGNLGEDWQKANKKDKTDGMSQKAVNAYKREHPGSKLKTAVTTKPSKLKKGSKASKRRSSYCARSKGQKDMHNIDCTKTPDKAICKARRRWNCESIETLEAMLREAVNPAQQAAIAIAKKKAAKIDEIKKGQKDSNGNTGCWDGYHAQGTKPGKNGPVRNCVKNESDNLDEMFGPELQAMGGIGGLLKDYGIPAAAFAAVAIAYGVNRAVKSLEDSEGVFANMARKALKVVDKDKVHALASKIHGAVNKSVAVAEDTFESQVQQQGISNSRLLETAARMDQLAKSFK